MTTVEKIEWSLKQSGNLIPKLHITPVYIPDPRGHIKVSKIHAHNAWWLMGKGSGVGSKIFLDTPYSFSVNFPMVPDIPQYCLCGRQFALNGRHFQCTNDECTHRGIGIIVCNVPISWVHAPIKFT